MSGWIDYGASFFISLFASPHFRLNLLSPVGENNSPRVIGPPSQPTMFEFIRMICLSNPDLKATAYTLGGCVLLRKLLHFSDPTVRRRP